MRKLWCVLVLSGVLGAPGLAQAGAIDKAMGKLRWGMDQSDVIQRLVERVDRDLERALTEVRGNTAKETPLRQEARHRIRELRSSYARFQGDDPSWAEAAIRREFAHGNDESGVKARDDHSSNYYFFHDGSLWKWVKVFEPAVFRGKSFRKVVRKRFGRGRAKAGALVYRRGPTRVRALRRGGSYVLIFEHVPRAKRVTAARRAKDEAKARAARADKQRSQRSASAIPARYKSLPEEDKTETREEYEARAARARKRQRRIQRRAWERKQDQKRSEVLKQLDTLGDPDPLSGLEKSKSSDE